MTALLLLLVGGARASLCYPEYQSIFHWLDSSLKQEFTFDLRPLCSGSEGTRASGPDLVFIQPFPPPNQARNWTMLYSIGGNVSARCNPRWTTYSSGGSFIQVWDTDRPLPGGTKKDPETGANVTTGHPCEVLASSRPEWDLLDESNPRTGGIQLRYSSVPDSASDGSTCPYDTRYNTPILRSLTIALRCDATIPVTVVQPLSFVETSTCTYTFTVATGAACGVAGDPYAQIYSGDASGTSAAASAGAQFGYTLLGGTLFAAGQWAVASGLLASTVARLRGKGGYAAPLGAPLGGGGGSYGSAA